MKKTLFITISLLFLLHSISLAAIYNQNNRVSIPDIIKSVETFEMNRDSLEMAKKRKLILQQLSIYGSKRTPEMDSEALGFIFHMIKLNIGEDKFNQGMEKVKALNGMPSLTYLQVLRCFEGFNADSFHESYFTKMPLMKLDISNAEYVADKDGYYISFTMLRTYGDTSVNIPYVLEYDNKKVYGRLQSSINREETFKVPVSHGTVSLIIDPNYHLMRQLNEGEKAPVIANMFFQDKVIYVSEKENQSLKNIIGNMETISSLDDLKFSHIDNSSVIIDGYDNKIAKFFTDKKISHKDNSDYFIFQHPQNEEKYIMIVNNMKDENIVLLNKYAMNQEVVFKGSSLVKSLLPDMDMGIKVAEHKSDVIVLVHDTAKFGNLMNNTVNYKTIFIGETHEDYAHHHNQLAVIDYMHNNRKKVAIGMEMVQAKYMNVVNDFIKGRITEKEMLDNIDYYKNWGFDYTLYAPIFKYARDNNIDIIPLNIPREVTSKVFNGSIDNLTEEEASYLPEKMSVLNDKYRKNIYSIFKEHKLDSSKFNNFYLSQNIWDEVMAKNLADYREVNPDAVIVVLCGNGHAGKNSGIPYRYKRLTGEESYVIMQGGELDNESADAYIYTEEINSNGTPSLGITITDDKNMVKIKSISTNSPASQAGLKNGDIIVKCGYHDINDIGNLKYALYEKGYNSTLECDIKRGKNTIKKRFKLFKYDNSEEISEAVKAHIEKMKNK